MDTVLDIYKAELRPSNYCRLKYWYCMFEKSASDSSCITGRRFTSENRKSAVKKLGPGTIPVAPSFIHFNFNVQIEPLGEMNTNQLAAILPRLTYYQYGTVLALSINSSASLS
jgi:hypothetical protein